jgi:dipeptidase E
MKLLLTSGGITNNSIAKALFELAGRPVGDLNLLFIPTAANPEKGDKSWVQEDIDNFKKLGFKSFEVVDISAQPKEIWKSKFDNADILVFGGGYVLYLNEWLERSGLKEMLPEMLKTKVYVGISAGSMVATKDITSEQIEIIYEEEEEYRKEKGLGFVDFFILPHLNSDNFPKVRMENLEKLAGEISGSFYTIDDNTAIMVKDGAVSIVSEGVWKKFS